MDLIIDIRKTGRRNSIFFFFFLEWDLMHCERCLLNLVSSVLLVFRVGLTALQRDYLLSLSSLHLSTHA
jgi:hypothetical protein